MEMCETEMTGSDAPLFENEDNSGNMFQRELSGLMLKKLMGEHFKYFIFLKL